MESALYSAKKAADLARCNDLFFVKSHNMWPVTTLQQSTLKVHNKVIMLQQQREVTHRHDVLHLAANFQAVVHVGSLLEAPPPHKTGLPVRRPSHIADVMRAVILYPLLPAPAFLLSTQNMSSKLSNSKPNLVSMKPTGNLQLCCLATAKRNLGLV